MLRVYVQTGHDEQAADPNGSGTHLSQRIGRGFAETDHHPTPRITRNDNDAMKSLVGSGYGATLHSPVTIASLFAFAAWAMESARSSLARE